MSKGSKRRKALVPDSKVENNWNTIFKNKRIPKTLKEGLTEWVDKYGIPK